MIRPHGTLLRHRGQPDRHRSISRRCSPRFPSSIGLPAPGRSSRPRNLPEFLADHAVCEQQVAMYALSLAGYYPDDAELVERAAALAAEEVQHFRRVVAILRKRGWPLGGRRKNPWAQSPAGADRFRPRALDEGRPPAVRGHGRGAELRAVHPAPGGRRRPGGRAPPRRSRPRGTPALGAVPQFAGREVTRRGSRGPLPALAGVRGRSRARPRGLSRGPRLRRQTSRVSAANCRSTTS